MSEQCVFLYNSAFCGTYLENVYAFLALPENTDVRLRYSIGQNVRSDMEVRSLNRCQALIVFIDRFNAGGYVYHPLRKCVITKAWSADRRLFVDCRLGAFVTATDPGSFTRSVQQIYARSPKLTGGNPKSLSDGCYIHQNPPMDFHLKTDNAWRENVDQLAQTKAFLPCSTFVRCEVFESNTPDKPARASRKGKLIIQANRDYTVRITYCHHGSGTTSVNDSISLALKAPTLCDSTVIKVQSALDTVDRPLPNFPPSCHRINGQLSITCSTGDYALNIPVIVQSCRLLVMTVLLVILMFTAVFLKESHICDSVGYSILLEFSKLAGLLCIWFIWGGGRPPTPK